jgi:hypothetical protein
LRHYLSYAFCLAACLAATAAAATINFSTGLPDGLIATGSRPSGPGIEIESADDFILGTGAFINHATFYGLLPTGASLSDVNQVRVEIYRVFPKDSTEPPSGNVPTRANSPSDVAFAERDSAVSDLTFTTSVVNPSFTAANSVLNGIFPQPGQFTGGEGPVTGQEVLFDVTLTNPFFLPASAGGPGNRKNPAERRPLGEWNQGDPEPRPENPGRDGNQRGDPRTQVATDPGLSRLQRIYLSRYLKLQFKDK